MRWDDEHADAYAHLVETRPVAPQPIRRTRLYTCRKCGQESVQFEGHSRCQGNQLAGRICTCSPGCTDQRYGDAGTCDPDCEVCNLLRGRKYDRMLHGGKAKCAGTTSSATPTTRGPPTNA